ncbi:expressed unknown protein [Seminavis robusta]|uniref:Uncharacterized protein n=1 Tax=Seminavis robusta TaxID=568900 RepID=A0A9N8DIS0_9STRA|nr:expressed unknown protein [Seminavis robusta]|eukprot:Sro143_g066540.1 n/a (483) ;mRNA; r:33992-35440
MSEEQQHKKVWNEDLVRALRARHQQAWQQQKQSQHQWRQGAEAVEKIRKDIRLTKTGKIFNLDAKLLTKTVYEECVKIIKGQADIEPPGFSPLSEAELMHARDNTVNPYITNMQKNSGAYAILLAFYISGKDSLSKQEIIALGQQFCSSEMEANYFAGRLYGAWKSKDTLIRHGLITQHKTGASYIPNRGFRSNGKHTFSISEDGKRATRQMLQKWPDIDVQPGSASDGVSQGHAQSAATPTRGYSSSATPKKKSAKSGDDEKELLQWIQSATEGQQKMFKGLGKDRRICLHKLCDKLKGDNPGLELEHRSIDGAGTRRDLYITLRRKPAGLSLGGQPYPATPPTKKRQHTHPSGSGGHKLGASAKKPRSSGTAAASAALARFEQNTPNQSPDKGASLSPIPSHQIVELNDSDDEEEDRKPAAKPSTAVSAPPSLSPIPSHQIVELNDSEDEEEDRKPAAKPSTAVSAPPSLSSIPSHQMVD